MEKFLKPSLLLVAVVALFSLVYSIFRDRSCRDFDAITQSGRIRVITENSTMGYKIDKDSIYGFQYDLMKAFADKLGLELEISGNDNTEVAIDDMLAGEYDVVAALIPVTSDYKDKILFTNPLQVDRQMLVQRNTDSSSLVTKQYELADDTIFLPAKSPYTMLISSLSEQIGDSIYVSELKNANSEDAVNMVAEGIIPFTICSERSAKKIQKLYPQLDISIPIGFQQSSSWVIPLNATKLQQQLNEFLFEFVGSSEYWDIYRKYF